MNITLVFIMLGLITCTMMAYIGIQIHKEYKKEKRRHHEK